MQHQNSLAEKGNSKIYQQKKNTSQMLHIKALVIEIMKNIHNTGINLHTLYKKAKEIFTPNAKKHHTVFSRRPGWYFTKFLVDTKI